MIGLVKNAFNKDTGCGLFSWQDLEEALLDVEITLNDGPLSYVEDDVALPILTPILSCFQPPTSCLTCNHITLLM